MTDGAVVAVVAIVVSVIVAIVAGLLKLTADAHHRRLETLEKSSAKHDERLRDVETGGASMATELKGLAKSLDDLKKDILDRLDALSKQIGARRPRR